MRTKKSDRVFETGSWVKFWSSATEKFLVLESDEYITTVYRPKTKRTLTYYTDDLTQTEKPKSDEYQEFKIGQEVYNPEVDETGTITEVYEDSVKVELHHPTEAVWKKAVIELEKTVTPLFALNTKGYDKGLETIE